MEWIVTAGAVSEKIDTVRSITNHATGELGRMTAEQLSRQGGEKVSKIYYICESSAQKPELPCVEICLVKGAEEAASALQKLLASRSIAGIVHSMAVSDYSVSSATDIEHLAVVLEKRLQSAAPPAGRELRTLLYESLSGTAAFPRNGKLSSNVEHLVLLLHQTPKIISLIKKVSPTTRLVGFKLLDNVPHAQLIDTAYALLLKNHCDFVLANDLRSIRHGCHTGYLVGEGRSVVRAEGKPAIAALVAEKLLSLLIAGGPAAR